MTDWLIKMQEAEAIKQERIRDYFRQQFESGEDAVSAGLTGAEHAAYVESLGNDS